MRKLQRRGTLPSNNCLLHTAYVHTHGTHITLLDTAAHLQQSLSSSTQCCQRL